MCASKVPAIVSSAWLQHQLSFGNRNLRLLDASWSPVTSGREAYLKQHIPGALFFDQDVAIKPKPTCPRNIPEEHQFQDYVRSLGVNKQSHLVVYDSTNIYASTKAWWTFRVFGHDMVSVLDGGLKQWTTDGFDVESGDKSTDILGDFEIQRNTSLLREYQDVAQNLKTNSVQILDARRREHFTGQDKEPCFFTIKGLESMNMPMPTSIHTGRIPGSINIPFAKILDLETDRFLPKEKLNQLFEDNGVDLSKPIVTTCYIGYAATFINIAAYICGYENTAMYYGSWVEYGQLATADMVERSE